MMEKIKKTFRVLTVKIGLVAAVSCFVCQYLPWLTEGKHSMSLAQAFAEKPGYFVGMPVILIVGVLWIAAFFLLNHPKLTLVGDAALLLIWLVLLTTASDFGLNLGIGAFLYLILVIVCIVMAFMTKKLKKEGGNTEAGK